MKIILLGSPQIAIDAFSKIIKEHNVVAIITKPDQKQNRGLKLKETPVAILGRKHNIKIFKPIKINAIYNDLKELNFDLLLTFAYGQFIPSQILALGKFPPMNIHGSLLPKYRGAAPIHYAVLNGDKELGITLIEMTKEMDAGDMYFKAKSNINDFTNVDQGIKIISKLASENINNWLAKIKNKEATPKKQSSNFTLAPKIKKSYGLIDSNLLIKDAKRRIRGLTSYPGVFTFIEGTRYKLFNYSNEYKNGYLILNLKDGQLFINDFQKENKKRNNLLMT